MPVLSLALIVAVHESAIGTKRTSPPCGGNATHTLLLRLTVSFPTYRFCARDSVTREGEQDWGR